jgi:hypothetical protein
VAWERRAELGWGKALWLTWKASMFEPESFWNGVRPAGPPVDALLYAWIVFAVGKLLSIPFALASPGGALAEQILRQSGGQSPEMTKYLEAAGQHGALSAVGTLVLTAILFPVVLVIAAAILHLFALLFSAAKNGYWATFRAMAYSCSPYAFAISCLGVISGIYSLVLTILGLARMQETTQGKAAAVTLTPFVLTCCSCCVLGVVMFGVIGSAMH